jgi:hypothetical protein
VEIFGTESDCDGDESEDFVEVIQLYFRIILDIRSSRINVLDLRLLNTMNSGIGRFGNPFHNFMPSKTIVQNICSFPGNLLCTTT